MSTDFSSQELWRDACDCFIDSRKGLLHVLDVARTVSSVEPEAELFLYLVGHCKTLASIFEIIHKQAKIEKTNGFLWYLVSVLAYRNFNKYIKKSIQCNYIHALAYAKNENDGSVDMKKVLIGYEKGCRHACFEVARFKLATEQNMYEYRRLVLKSATAGYIHAIIHMIEHPILFTSDTNQWKWICCLVFKGQFDLFLFHLQRVYVEQQHLNMTINYLIGKCVYRTFYEICFDKHIPRDQLREFYLKQVKAARAAVNAASACFLRMGVYKDLRVLLCQWVWAGRDEANY